MDIINTYHNLKIMWKYIIIILCLLVMPKKVRHIKVLAHLKTYEISNYLKCINLIQKRESLRLYSYQCPSGKNTIGYGSVNTGLIFIDSSQAEKLLIYDFNKALNYAKILHPKVTLNKQYVIATILYCVGYGNYTKSEMYKNFRDTLEFNYIYKNVKNGEKIKSTIDMVTLNKIWRQ